MHWCESGVLSAGPLAVVCAAHDETALIHEGPLREGLVYAFEDVLRDGGDIGA